SGQTEDSAAKRYVWNAYNRSERLLQKFEGTSTWAYSTNTIRQANASTANQVDAITGFAEDLLHLEIRVSVQNSTTGTAQMGVGVDSTTPFASGNVGGFQQLAAGATTFILQVSVRYEAIPTIGKHTYSWNEASNTAATTTWNDRTNNTSQPNHGLIGWVKG